MLNGTRLGPYEVLEPLGAGGMGEVYRARDTKLGRDVALKILPRSLAGDPDRLMRFDREARTLAALNHTHIAQIHGVEESAGGPALVMELVEGEDLGQRVTRGPLPLDEALSIGRQIADALEAAHDAGIVHRDLKPANVKVRPDGTVKVLDFGLAKLGTDGHPAASADPMNSPTVTMRGTRAGVILGTAAYMAPEQARGQQVDRRADIWAFGCVLYELLTGVRAFRGETVPDILAAIVSRDPDWAALPPTVPAAVRTLLARCLTRDPRRRLRDIGEARVALEDDTSFVEAPAPSRPVSGPSRLTWLATTLALAAVTGLTVWVFRTPADVPQRRFMIPTPDGTEPLRVAITPAGDAVAFIAAERAWIQRLDEFAPAEVPSSNGATIVFWSPDGAFLGFQARNHLWKTPRGGGSPIAVARVPSNFNTSASGAAWLDDGRIVFTTGMTTGLLEVPHEGGDPRSLLDVNPETDRDFHNVSALPGGRGFLFATHRRDSPTYEIEIYVPAEGTRRVVRGASPADRAVYSTTGHLLLDRDGSVWILPFSLERLEPTGDASVLVAGARLPSVARDGTVVMLPDARGDTQLAWVDRAGELRSILGQPNVRISHPRISPDGRSVAATIGMAPQSDVGVLELERGTYRQLTFEQGENRFPVWTPDGRHVVYVCGRAICARRADGSGQRIELVDEVLPWSGPALSPDGRLLMFLGDKPPATALWIIDLDPEALAIPATATRRSLLATDGMISGADVSPDGRFIAYVAQETGQGVVYVSRFPSGDGKWDVSRGRGLWPRWGSAGDRLYFVDAVGRIVEMQVDLRDTFQPGAILTRGPASSSTNFGYDVAADGTQFLVPRLPGGQTRTASLLFVQNWQK